MKKIRKELLEDILKESSLKIGDKVKAEYVERDFIITRIRGYFISRDKMLHFYFVYDGKKILKNGKIGEKEFNIGMNPMKFNQPAEQSEKENV